MCEPGFQQEQEEPRPLPLWCRFGLEALLLIAITVAVFILLAMIERQPAQDPNWFKGFMLRHGSDVLLALVTIHGGRANSEGGGR